MHQKPVLIWLIQDDIYCLIMLINGNICSYMTDMVVIKIKCGDELSKNYYNFSYIEKYIVEINSFRILKIVLIIRTSTKAYYVIHEAFRLLQ